MAWKTIPSLNADEMISNGAISAIAKRPAGNGTASMLRSTSHSKRQEQDFAGMAW